MSLLHHHRKGAPLNEKNKDTLTPLHIAADKSHYDIMDILLKHGAKVNALDASGETALHRCAREGNVQACRVLLSFGADSSIVSLQVSPSAGCFMHTQYPIMLLV